MADVTLESQKILSCIYRMEQRYGLTMVIKVLKGSTDRKLKDNRLDQVSTYGLLSDMPEGSIKEVIMALISRGYVHMTTDAYPVLKLRAESKRILNGEERVLVRKSRIDVMRKSKKTDKKSRPAASLNEGLYDQLVALRKSLAAKKSVPTYVIFHNKALEEMAQMYPRSRSEFLEISGVGEKKYETYGEKFAQVISDYCRLHGVGES
jgi:ATP-dependent DNA helicase RecQ